MHNLEILIIDHVDWSGQHNEAQGWSGVPQMLQEGKEDSLQIPTWVLNQFYLFSIATLVLSIALVPET